MTTFFLILTGITVVLLSGYATPGVLLGVVLVVALGQAMRRWM